jgi:hypothetical protein
LAKNSKETSQYFLSILYQKKTAGDRVGDKLKTAPKAVLEILKKYWLVSLEFFVFRAAKNQ